MRRASYSLARAPRFSWSTSTRRPPTRRYALALLLDVLAALARSLTRSAPQVSLIRANGGVASALVADVTKATDCQRMIEEGEKVRGAAIAATCLRVR